MRICLSLPLFTFLCFSSLLTGQAYLWDVGIFDGVEPDRQALSEKVNAPLDNGFPVISLDGHTLLFTRKGHALNFGPSDAEDIWVSRLDAQNDWTQALNAGAPINDYQENYVAGIDPLGEIIYLLSFNQPDQTAKLLMVKKKGRLWDRTIEMHIDSFHHKFKYAPSFSVSADGRYLFISMPSSKTTGKDIFVSFRRDRFNWTAPFRLSNTINTNRDETSAFLAPDGKTLYFSSNGHKGFGGQDLFISKRLDDSWLNWSNPINLGDQINTSKHDTHLSVPANGQYAIYTSFTKKEPRQIFQVNLPSSIQPNPIELIKGKIDIETSGALSLKENYGPLSGSFGSSGSLDFVIPHQPGHVIELFKGMRNFYPEVKDKLIPAEELDFDKYNLLSSINDDQVVYFQREAEIEMLQIQLNDLSQSTQLTKIQFERTQSSLADLIKNLKLSSSTTQSDLNSGLLDTIPPIFNKTIDKDSIKIDRKKIDKELVELRKKFNQFYPEKNYSEEDDQFLWGRAMGYDDFKDQVTDELILELAPEVAQELKFQLYGEVIQELELELPDEALRQLESNETNLREQIRQSFIIGDQVSKSPPEYADNDLQDWQKDLKRAIKESIEDEVKAQLEEALRMKVKETLKSQLSYLTQKGVEEDLEQQLNRKVNQQIKQEEELGIATQGLIPLSFEYQPASPVIPYDFQTIERNYNLVPIVEGQAIRLGNISFGPNSAVLKPKAYEELNQLVDFLKNHPKLNVEIAAHTNGYVSHAFAQELSDKRAQVVVHYLEQNGISGKRLTAAGYGKKKPLASNETLEGRRMNQRIELIILK